MRDFNEKRHKQVNGKSGQCYPKIPLSKEYLAIKALP
jgi:hypothetical protein